MYGREMRIVAVKTAVVEANYDYTYVRVFADNGEYGTGECFFSPGLTGIIRDLSPVLIGKDPRHIERLTRELRRAASGAGAVAGYAHNAISGMEAALWDLIGKHFRVPVWQLFGGQFRDQIRIYADCHAGEGLESWGPALLPPRADLASQGTSSSRHRGEIGPTVCRSIRRPRQGNSDSRV